MINLKNKLVLFAMTLASCTSPNRGLREDLRVDQLDAVKLGQSKDEVKKKLGPAKQFYKLKEQSGPTQILWIYNNSINDYQRATISFNAESQLVISKIFVPEINDAEVSLEFVLNKKFPEISFKELPPKMCLDYMPTESTYFNLESGTSIIYNTRTKTVESISWTSPVELKKQISRIQTCEKRDYEMTEAHRE